MRINFLAPGLEISGGMRAIFEYANRLERLGHRVTIVCPVALGDDERGRLSWRAALRRWGRTLLADRRVPWFDLRARLLVVPRLEVRRVPAADITIATQWRTAELLGTWGESVGKPVYFVQGYEIWAGPRDRVDATYRLPMSKFVVSSWLKRLLREKFGQEPAGPIIYGVDFDLFHHEPQRRSGSDVSRVGMIYRPTTWRGTLDGLQAVEIVRRKHPGILLSMFGQDWPGPDVPEGTEYRINVPQSELRQVYSSCDIWIHPSWHEGLPLPPMEAMACRCALLTTDVGVEDYLIPDVTAMVVPARQPQLMSEALLRLVEDAAKRRSIAEAGHKHIQAFTWDRAAARFDEELRRVLRS